MGENTKIEWARHTFNPWYGCQAVSPACDFCYAEGWAKRSGLVGWGPHAPRRRSSPASWREPLKWNAAAKAAGEKHSVFGPSLGDPFDNQVDHAWRRDYFDLISATPNLIYLLLTKRPANILYMVDDAGGLPPNVALGTTVEDQLRADRNIPELIAAKRRLAPAFAFLSCEPLLGPIVAALHEIDWLICGGESGHGARPSHLEWHRMLRDQCAQASVPFFFKQWGEWLPWSQFAAASIDDLAEQTRFDTCEWDGENDRWEDAGRPMWCDTVDGDVNDEECVGRVGRKRAGHLLDGVEHKALPPSLRSVAA